MQPVTRSDPADVSDQREPDDATYPAAGVGRALLIGFAQRARALGDRADRASNEIMREVERHTVSPSAEDTPDELIHALTELTETVAQRFRAIAEECDRLTLTLEQAARSMSAFTQDADSTGGANSASRPD
jgi:hypothetical protein